MKISDIKIDPNMNDDYSWAFDILDQGYDKEFPVLIDEDGWILEGNHRFVVYRDASRLNEVSFAMIDWDTYCEIEKEENQKGNMEKFEDDYEYFYSVIMKHARRIEVEV